MRYVILEFILIADSLEGLLPIYTLVSKIKTRPFLTNYFHIYIKVDSGIKFLNICNLSTQGVNGIPRAHSHF